MHAAARAEDWGSREQFWSANVEGTTRLLELAQSAGVRRFVFIGTEAAFFVGADLIDLDETHPYPEKHRYLYSETKAEAERRVLAANRTGGFETISLRPRLVWGPRDQSVLPALSKMARDGSFAWIDKGSTRTSTTHVDNLVHAVLLALGNGTPGSAYFVADEGERTMQSFLSALLKSASDMDLGTRSMPSWFMRPLAAATECVFRTLRPSSPLPLSRFAIDMMASSVTVRTDKARRELGYAPVISVEEGLAKLARLRGGEDRPFT